MRKHTNSISRERALPLRAVSHRQCQPIVECKSFVAELILQLYNRKFGVLA